MNKTILVIDDDEDILDALRFTLESEGYTVIISENGEYAEKLQRNKRLPDLIILDMLLSGRDGRIICRKLKEQTFTKHIPILMTSAHPEAEKSIKMIAADDFIAKPFEVSVFLKKITKLLK